MSQTIALLVNFGGPRSVEEIESFLKALLTDKEVIRTKIPRPLEYLLFTRVAKKRAHSIAKDYELIGGKSPIFDDTEEVAKKMHEHLGCKVLTFHRYLASTHEAFIKEINRVQEEEIRIFPLFPQFSYATTGSIARFFSKHLKKDVLNRMRWVPSYAGHSAYVNAMQKCLGEYLLQHSLKEEETLLLFSAHGLPRTFVEEGDIYESECKRSFAKIAQHFKARSLLAYQSKFGKGEWLKPYTNEMCDKIEGYKNVVFVPLSFTSDHIETLFEIEHLYLPLVQKRGINAYRCPALNLREDWLKAICEIFQHSSLLSNSMLIRRA